MDPWGNSHSISLIRIPYWEFRLQPSPFYCSHSYLMMFQQLFPGSTSVQTISRAGAEGGSIEGRRTSASIPGLGRE